MQMITSKASVTIGTTRPPVTNGRIQVTDEVLKFTIGRKEREVLTVDADDIQSVDTTRGTITSMLRWVLLAGVAPVVTMLMRGARQGLSGGAAIAIAAGFAVFLGLVVFFSARTERVRVAYATNAGIQEAFFVLPSKTRDAMLQKLQTLAA